MNSSQRAGQSLTLNVNFHVAYLSFLAAADAHFPVHPLSAGELAVEAETAPEGGNDYSIRECVITFSLLCMLFQPAECHIFVFLICKMRKKHISQLWTKMTRVLCIF